MISPTDHAKPRYNSVSDPTCNGPKTIDNTKQGKNARVLAAPDWPVWQRRFQR